MKKTLIVLGIVVMLTGCQAATKTDTVRENNDPLNLFNDKPAATNGNADDPLDIL